jgi:hypothetical protein
VLYLSRVVVEVEAGDDDDLDSIQPSPQLRKLSDGDDDDDGDDLIYFQYDSSTPLRFSAPA